MNTNSSFVPHSPNNPGTAFLFSPRGTFMPGFMQQSQIVYPTQNSNASVSAISSYKAALLTEMDSKNPVNSGPSTPNSGRSTGFSIRPGSAASTHNTGNTLTEQKGSCRKRKKVTLIFSKLKCLN